MEWLLGLVIVVAIYGQFEVREKRNKQRSELQRLESAIGDSASSTSAEAIHSHIDDASIAPQSQSQRSQVATHDSANVITADTMRSQIDHTNDELFFTNTFAVVVVPLTLLFGYIEHEHQSTGNGWEILDAIMFTVAACVLLVWFFISGLLLALGIRGLRTPDYGAFAGESRRDPDDRKRRSRRILWVGWAGHAIGLAGFAWLYLSL